jgi:diguanylate cyclase (GGDEF)-like protein
MVAVSVGAPGGSGDGARAGEPGQAAAQARSRLRFARRAYPAAFGLLVALYAFVPAMRAPVYVLFGLLSAAAVAYGTAVLRPQRWGAWLLLAVAVLLLGVGDFLAATHGAPNHRHPGASDAVYLATYVPLAIGLLGLGKPTSAGKDWPTSLDTMAFSLSATLVVWIWLVRVAVTGHEFSVVAQASAIGAWVSYTLVLAACGRLLILWRSNRAAILLSTGVVAYLAADFSYERSVVLGPATIGLLAQIGFLAFYGLCGYAALQPDMAAIATRETGPARYDIGPRRLVLLGLTMLVAPTALLVEAATGAVTTGVAIGLISGVVSLLLLIRLGLSARAYRRRGVSADAVRTAMRSLVLATTATEVTASLTTALRAILPRTSGAHAWVAEQGGHDGEPKGTSVKLSPRENGLGDLLVRVGGDTLPVTGAYAIGFTAPLRYLVDASTTLEALAEQAGAGLARIDLVGALQAEERERYFRTLVLTSTDVTLICRSGRVDYATPSAQAMFGREVRGAIFDELIATAADPLPGAPGESSVDGWDGVVRRADGTLRNVRVQPRDLSDDPTVNGFVVTVRDVTAERDLQRSLAYRATHDALTGLANADQLRDQLRADRDRADRDRTDRERADRDRIDRDRSDRDRTDRDRTDRDRAPSEAISAVLFVDLDDFKQVNDTYGHEVGDGLLVNVAYRIRSVLRNEDVAARLGGDEFAALLRGVSDEDAARRTAQRIADDLARPVQVAGVTVDSGASVGLAIARSPAEFDSLLRRADTALYIAKAEGKGAWREYRDGMVSPIRRRSDLRVELENAMRDDTLALHYQPIVDLDTGRAVGFEGLIRFERDGGGSIAPQELIRIAEENGLIGPLGDWVIRRAVRDIPVLSPRGSDPPPYVSVNVSPNQLRHKGFVESIRERLRVSHVDPSRLVLEVTERLMVAEDAQAWRDLEELRSIGVRVAIDDYGTGCASLSYLRQPSIDIVKIDRSFVQDLRQPRDQALFDAVVRLTVQLGLPQIAEGIETAEIRDIVRGIGCRYAQGYFYCPPLPLPAAAAWADTRQPVA